ncbi:MAG: DUF1778 domain-containing protein [Actinomycetaceae bacterium]|nr:DUF1778 domain-containing protein [Actinomycetaceae bacterium]
MAVVSKNRRINLRATERQESVLKQAALASDSTVSEFILSSAVQEAERILADKRWFGVSVDQYEQFVKMLDMPVSSKKLAKLFARDSVFDAPFEMED